MITQDNALEELRRLSDPYVWNSESPVMSMRTIGAWCTYAQEALQRGDVQTAKSCIAVVSRIVDG